MGIFSSKQQGDEVFIDFENASSPSASESALHGRVSALLAQQSAVSEALQQYTGCQELARKAMTTPTPDNEREAFEGLLHSIDAIALFFRFSSELSAVVPDLLLALVSDPASSSSSPNIHTSKEYYQQQTALVKQLADIFDFALRFDALRIKRPFLSNDFSYYKRLLPKFNKHPNIKVKDDEASTMGLFIADSSPMMGCVAKAAQSALERNERVNDALIIMCNSCFNMLKTNRFSKTSTQIYVATAMTGAIVCYDHVSIGAGVFRKNAPIKIKPIIRWLKANTQLDAATIPVLLNAIQYATKHFKQASDATKELFE